MIMEVSQKVQPENVSLLCSFMLQVTFTVHRTVQHMYHIQ